MTAIVHGRAEAVTNLSYVEGAAQAFVARVIQARANCRAADAALSSVLASTAGMRSCRRALGSAAELCDEAIASAHIAAAWVDQLTEGDLAALATIARAAPVPAP